MGAVKRGAASHERVALLRFSGGGGWLAVQGAGRGLEMFRVRDEDEARRKMKRRKKRRKEKSSKKEKEGKGKGKAGAAADSDDEDDAAGVGAADDGEDGIKVCTVPVCGLWRAGGCPEMHGRKAAGESAHVISAVTSWNHDIVSPDG